MREKGRDRGRVMSDMCSRVVQKLNRALKKNGLAGDEEFPGGYHRGRAYEKIKTAFQNLDAKAPLLSDLADSKTEFSSAESQ